jgi:hypothetical protein
MARYAATAHIRRTVRLDGHRVAFAVHVHENGAESELRVRGAGIGRHMLRARLDRGGATFDQEIGAEWVGDELELPLPFIPHKAIVTFDGHDEIRF